MDKIEIIEIAQPITNEVIKYVVIDHGDDQFTSMPKSQWDELEAQREQSGTL